MVWCHHVLPGLTDPFFNPSSLPASAGRHGLEGGHQDIFRQHQQNGSSYLPASVKGNVSGCVKDTGPKHPSPTPDLSVIVQSSADRHLVFACCLVGS